MIYNAMFLELSWLDKFCRLNKNYVIHAKRHFGNTMVCTKNRVRALNVSSSTYMPIKPDHIYIRLINVILISSNRNSTYLP